MADNRNEAEIIPKKLSFTSMKSEGRSRASSIIDLHTPVASVLPVVTLDPVEDDDSVPLFTTGQIYKNLAILSTAFVLIYIAFLGVVSLQSTMNAKGNVGVNSLIVLNAFILVGSLFLTGIAMDVFGLKWTINIGAIAYILYVCANLRPIPILMYTTAALIGLASAPFWTAQATYISRIARDHAHHKQTIVGNTISLFFGIFFAVFSTSTIWGSIITYVVLNQPNNPQRYNCGIHFNPLAPDKMKPVTDTKRYLLCGIYGGIAILSLVLLLFLDQIRLAERQPLVQSLKKSAEVIRSLFRWKHVDQLFLVPITMWTMIETGFLQAQFTRAFITCLVGIRFIGAVLGCTGICDTIFSYVFGGLVKYIGRLGCFMIAAILNYISIFIMYFWDPQEDQVYVLYIIASLWGAADAVWQSQVVAVYTVLYAETDSSAIAKYRLWKAVGSLLTYSYASYVSIEYTLVIIFTFLTVSMIFYGVVEVRIRWKTKTNESDRLINNTQ